MFGTLIDIFITSAGIVVDTSLHFEKEKQRREVRAATKANRLRQTESCFLSRFAVEEAKAFYQMTVRLTIDHSEQFFIQNGAVGGRLHLLTIPPEGSVQEECVDPERYVGEPGPSAGGLSEFMLSPDSTGGESS